jgi:hypothetical protein
MPVNPTDLGTAVCRAIMRDLDDKPVILETFNLATHGRDFEYTSASERAIAAQWCVILLPLPDCVGVRAHLKFWGMGIWDQAELADGDNKHNLFVRYPEDPAQIMGAEYESALRAAVSKALAAIEADRAKVRSGA